MKKISSGNWDIFLTLGDDLVIKIVSYLDLQSISQLSQVNQHMREVCNSTELWEVLYKIHQGSPSSEVCALAKELGWKEVFFMNKLQLQKEISRRRKVQYDPENPDSSLSPDSTFLTES